MKIFTHNFNPYSNSGPNKFSRTLFSSLSRDYSIEIAKSQKDADIEYCLIQQELVKVKPMILRLDGIWFNSDQDYERQNAPIKFAYENADAVIYQSFFNKTLTEKWFGCHENSHIIHNAPDRNMINSDSINKTYNKIDWPWDKDTEVWCCASSWRPHKRLKENIRYFLIHAPENAVLGIAGSGVTSEDVGFSSDPRIHFFGELNYPQLLCLYRRSSVFVHLAYLDHCPNVVVDAQASGCKIVCSSSGGTKEIVSNGIIISEPDWDFKPTQLYKPPKLNFEITSELHCSDKPDIADCAKSYYSIMKNLT